MSALDVGFKWKLNTPYLTEGEVTVFKRARKNGAITAFRCTICQGYKDAERKVKCEEDVPRIIDDETGELLKRFCNKTCWLNSDEGERSTDEYEDDDGEDW